MQKSIYRTERYHQKPLTYAYSALYESVFGKEKIRQNNWVEQEIDGKTFKFKIWSDKEEIIYIWLFDAKENVMFETIIDFDFRKDTNIYSLESKIVKVNSEENNSYTYGYYVRDGEQVLNFDFVSFDSTNKIAEKQENYEISSININEISKIDGNNKKFALNLTADQKNEIVNYLLEDLDVNFAEYNTMVSVKCSKIKTMQNAYAYYNK